RPFSSTRPHQARYVRFNETSQSSRDWRPSTWDRQSRILGGVGLVAVTYYVYHLEQVPETGRWRFMDISPGAERKLAEQTHAQLLQEYRGKILPPNHPLTLQVKKIVTRLLEASDLGHIKADAGTGTFGEVLQDLWHSPSGSPDMASAPSPPTSARNPAEWNVMVVNDPKIVNAMATFGSIVVFTGILPICQDENVLAAVLGHEIAHAVARHPSESLSYGKVLFLISYLLELAGLSFGFGQILTSLVLQLPNSRTHELEADKLGLFYSARACYDPRGAPELQSRLSNLEKHKKGGFDLGFLSTHPTSEVRIKALERLLPDADSIRASSERCSGMEEALGAF
ncbi:hypothetical protein SISSUDRAFT_975683, partial [Sistotremastrum suecicum HHB10207 ss-3]